MELEEREDHLRKLEADFNQELTQVEVEDISSEPVQPLVGPVHVPPPELAAEMPSADPIQGPNDLKKLWRLIAVACHPDKTKNDPHLTQLYKEAESAWRTGSYDTLYRIAIELNLDPPEQSEESLAILKGIASDLEKQIQEKEQSVLWTWGGGDEQQKSMIVDVYLKLRGKKRK